MSYCCTSGNTTEHEMKSLFAKTHRSHRDFEGSQAVSPHTTNSNQAKTPVLHLQEREGGDGAHRQERHQMENLFPVPVQGQQELQR